jgi:hydroxyethylthiazole kinase-like uncharacterized protein yjeF
MSTAIYTLEALRALEARADAAGLDLMARAGEAAANWIAARLPVGARVLVAAGPGNNGGDALIAAAALLRNRYQVDVLQPAAPKSPAAQQALQTWLAAGGRVQRSLTADWSRPELIVDGLFGIGVDRPFSEPWAELIARLNESGAPILALDTPSGLDAWSGRALNAAVHADATLTFLCHKPGLFTGNGADLAGKVFLDTLQHPGWAGHEPEGALNHAGAAASLRRRRNSHKGSHGTVVIAGGAPGMLGAALLAGRAALSAGAGKVLVAALDDRLAVDPLTPELMLRPADTLPEGRVTAIGPGLGQESAARVLLAQALARTGPLVLDADALNLLAADASLATKLAERQAPAVLTPHPAEAARLLDTDTAAVQNDRLHAARALAERLNAVVVLKGAGSLIVGPDGYYHVNTTGGPALAAAGQGDVLTGIIAALLGQGLDAFAAASLAVWAHGRAGDLHPGVLGLSASATAARIPAILNPLIPPPGKGLVLGPAT